MNETNNKGSAGFGFIMGMVFGGVLTYFLVTKKGRWNFKKLVEDKSLLSELASFFEDLAANSEDETSNGPEATSQPEKISTPVLGRRFFKRSQN